VATVQWQADLQVQPDGIWTPWNLVAEAQDGNRRTILKDAPAALPE